MFWKKYRKEVKEGQTFYTPKEDMKGWTSKDFKKFYKGVMDSINICSFFAKFGITDYETGYTILAKGKYQKGFLEREQKKYAEHLSQKKQKIEHRFYGLTGRLHGALAGALCVQFGILMIAAEGDVFNLATDLYNYAKEFLGGSFPPELTDPASISLDSCGGILGTVFAPLLNHRDKKFIDYRISTLEKLKIELYE